MQGLPIAAHQTAQIAHERQSEQTTKKQSPAQRHRTWPTTIGCCHPQTPGTHAQRLTAEAPAQPEVGRQQQQQPELVEMIAGRDGASARQWKHCEGSDEGDGERDQCVVDPSQQTSPQGSMSRVEHRAMVRQ